MRAARKYTSLGPWLGMFVFQSSQHWECRIVWISPSLSTNVYPIFLRQKNHQMDSDDAMESPWFFSTIKKQGESSQMIFSIHVMMIFSNPDEIEVMDIFQKISSQLPFWSPKLPSVELRSWKVQVDWKVLQDIWNNGRLPCGKFHEFLILSYIYIYIYMDVSGCMYTFTQHVHIYMYMYRHIYIYIHILLYKEYWTVSKVESVFCNWSFIKALQVEIINSGLLWSPWVVISRLRWPKDEVTFIKSNTLNW